jgi:hypothetical protein
MKQTSVLLVSAVLILLLAAASPAEAGVRFGGGIHYLNTLGDIKDDSEFDENSIGIMGSLLLTSQILKLEAAVEYIPDYAGLDEALILPQGYVLLGGLIYGGVGIGLGYFDGEWFDDPFYALRAGVDIYLGGLDLDVFATYRFQKWDALDGLESDDADSITFGALIRFGSK